MLLMVRRGPLGGGDGVQAAADGAGDGPKRPLGSELWWGEIENITVSALLVAEAVVEPGEWYSFEDFRSAIDGATPEPEQAVMSAITTEHPGVSRPWRATLEVHETSAALMVCRAVIAHVEQLGIHDVWVRVE